MQGRPYSAYASMRFLYELESNRAISVAAVEGEGVVKPKKPKRQVSTNTKPGSANYTKSWTAKMLTALVFSRPKAKS